MPAARSSSWCEGRTAAQTSLLQLSTDSQQLFAEQSGHQIMIEQPEAAIGAIVQMVEQIRR
jgi:hypothetical protein